MDYNFNTREALAELEAMLDKYNSEDVEGYAKETFIADVIYFLGKSIDKEKYGGGWSKARDFLAIEIYEIAKNAHESRKQRFARKLGMRT